jgi:hypothetical protein
MKEKARLRIEKLPEGVYLTTSDDIQGLIAQGRTVEETVDISLDVAKKLIGLEWTELDLVLPDIEVSDEELIKEINAVRSRLTP